MANKKTRPRDPNQLAKHIVDLATGQAKEAPEPVKDPAAVTLGRKGGKARAEKLSPEDRRTNASKAARTRWGSGEQ